ncbi:MAG: sulfotransferase [Kiritimatiellae bacterium]|nr:sulfotransferase [Kiritimatiellia bacterium]
MFTAKAFIEEAQNLTGLDDFGEDGWSEGLKALVHSINEDASINRQGEEVFHKRCMENLVNRLKVVDWVNQYPEIRNESIRRPFIITGLFRSGTTILNNLLAQDPKNRPLIRWESLDSIPPPKKGSFDTDPRALKRKQDIINTFKKFPDRKSIHYEPHNGSTECLVLLEQDFRGYRSSFLFQVPSYNRWLHECDMTSAYAYHKMVLQILQSKAPGRWSLKAPSHLLALKALTATYPDAHLIFTHRDIVKVVGSTLSLAKYGGGDLLTNIDRSQYIREEWLNNLEVMVKRMMSFRDHCRYQKIYDFKYNEFMKEPIGSIRDMYDSFDEELTPDAETAMKTFLSENPKNRHGKHDYTLEDFGVSTEKITERFSEYVNAYL